MIRNDGDYIIYVIQFKYVRDKDKGWHNAGACDHFMKKAIDRKEWEKIRFKTPFRNLGANGECWQKTGIEGTFELDDATYALMKIAKWNPGRHFRVAKIEISQKTTRVVTAIM